MTTGEKMHYISAELFSSEIQHEKRPVLLACLHHDEHEASQMNILHELSGRFESQVRIFIIDGEREKVVMRQYRISGTPTFLLLYNGTEWDRSWGRSDFSSLQSFLQRNLSRQNR